MAITAFGVYLLVSALIFAFGPDAAWVASPPFVLAHAMAMSILSGIVSFLLYSHAARTGNRGYLPLAGAFASMLVFMAVFPLSFPGAVLPVTEQSAGVLAGSPQTSIATFFVWHLVLYTSLPISAVLIARGSRRRRQDVGVGRTVLSLVVWVGGAVAFIWVAIRYPDVLPTLFVPATGITTLSVVVGWLLLAIVVVGFIVVAVITRARSPISRWILTVLIVSIGEALVAIGSERFSIGWYFNRAFGIAAMTFLVTSLIWEIARVDQPALKSASYDVLTQTMTRPTFERALDATAFSTHAPPQPVAMLWIDLDDFKNVNALIGHHSADAVLAVIARRIQEQLRPDDLIARVGGDEFAVAIVGPGSREAAASIARRLVTEVARPIDEASERVTTSCSVGVAVAPDQAMTVLDLAHKSDIAMREAKWRGGNRVSHYLPGMDERTRALAELRNEIEEGITAGEFVPYAQSIVDVRTRAVVGLEILARWEHAGAIVPLADVIEVAEASRLIIAIGERIRAATGTRLQELFDANPTLEFVTMNLAVNELTEETAMATLLADPWVVFAGRLVIEITESAILYASGPAQASLEALHEAGYRLAVDDYGVGFSTIARLEQLGATIVKSDRSLLTRQSVLSADPRDLIRVVYDIARALKGSLIVEGVENEAEETMVREVGPVLAQGYLYDHPAPLNDWCAGLTRASVPNGA